MKTTTRLGWIARIFCFAAIIFVSLFAMDALEYGDTVLQKLASLGMHLIPSAVLTIVLIIAWKHELTGGIVFMLIGIGTSPFIYNLNYARTQSVAICMEVMAMINLPFIIIGALFLFSYFQKKENQLAK